MATDGDSFIHEVSEELRRDRMYRVWRRFGPWLILALTLFVLWFAWSEWSKHQNRRAAEARGDAYAAAVALPPGPERVSALEALSRQGGGAAPVVLMRAGGILLEEKDAAGAAASFSAAARSAQLPESWRELARLRALMAEADSKPPAELLAALEPLTAETQPWRYFARELKAMVQMRAEDFPGASATLEALASAENLPGGMSARVEAMRRALGVVEAP
ncbi:tetratricopeptide repeat protein [Neomegalonema perideroedes]|uniref:tetratricopeptide repeat protein n=1 Tax=Neomegalonema perideroedes TaxID=217219 RepID=UPI000374287B|nr:tetratricopeptide repeat protein [Neomegalonema perideroedes]